jgi:single-strand DNA-binding protein
MNHVSLIGRLTRDPEVRYSGDQMAIGRFSIAIDRPPRRDGTKETDFPNIVVFGKQAENCERFLKKGRLVGVQGRLQTGSYTNKDGATVYTTDVVADRVEFLEWGDRQSSGEASGQRSYSAPREAAPQYQSAEPQGMSEPQEEFAPDGFTSIEEDIPF